MSSHGCCAATAYICVGVCACMCVCVCNVYGGLNVGNCCECVTALYVRMSVRFCACVHACMCDVCGVLKVCDVF